MRDQQIPVAADNASASAAKNFPPFYPLVRHAIADVPEGDARALVSRSYFLWQIMAAVSALSLPVTLVHFFSGVAGFESVARVIVAGVYAVASPSVSFFTWHMLLYAALSGASMSKAHMLAYLAVFTIQLILSALSSIGLIGGAAGGAITTVDAFVRGKIVSGIAGAATTLIATFAVLLGCVQLRRAILFYTQHKQAPTDDASA